MNIEQILQSKAFKQFMKFVLVGGSAFLIDFTINTLIVMALSWDPQKESLVANIISYSISLIYNYYMSSKWTFGGNETKYQDGTMTKFVLVNLFNLTWSSLLISYIVGIFPEILPMVKAVYIQPLAKVLVTSFMIIISFVLYKKFVFKDQSHGGI